jgi:hypothetical protein
LERSVYRSIAWQRCREIFTTTLCSNQRSVARHSENTTFLIVALRVFGDKVFNGQLPSNAVAIHVTILLKIVYIFKKGTPVRSVHLKYYSIPHTLWQFVLEKTAL